MFHHISFQFYMYKYWKLLFFPIFSLKNKEKYQFSICLQLKLIKIIIKHFLFINIEKKSRIEQAVTRHENNSLLSKPIPWNFVLIPGYRFWQQGIILKTSYSLYYARFFLYINKKKFLMIILISFSCKYTEKWYFF